MLSTSAKKKKKKSEIGNKVRHISVIKFLSLGYTRKRK